MTALRGPFRPPKGAMSGSDEYRRLVCKDEVRIWKKRDVESRLSNWMATVLEVKVESVDVFGVREQLIADYRAFTSSFVDVRDLRVREHIDRLTDRGYQWPDMTDHIAHPIMDAYDMPATIRSAMTVTVRDEAPPSITAGELIRLREYQATTACAVGG